MMSDGHYAHRAGPMLEQLRELCEGMKREMRVLRDNAGQANSVLPNQPQLGYM